MAPSFARLVDFGQAKRSSDTHTRGPQTGQYPSNRYAKGIKSNELSVDLDSHSQQPLAPHVSPTASQISLTFSSPEVEAEDAFGLKLFNTNNRQCKEIGDFQVDIVALHGLDGSRESTWTFGETSGQQSEQGSLWLRDYLPADLPGSRIFTYGYNSKVKGSRSVSGINDFALQLLEDLRLERKTHEVSESIAYR